jgi:hypothetical protein
MDGGTDDELANIAPAINNRLDSSNTRDIADFRQTILSSQVMVTAYAISIVILCLGMILMTGALMFLCFFFPEKANAFLVMVGSPLIALIVSQLFGIRRLVIKNKEKANADQ